MAAPTQTPHQFTSTSPANKNGNNDSSLIQVTVPPGVLSGQKIHVVAPDGRIIEAVVPPDMSAGSSFIVRAPRHPQSSQQPCSATFESLNPSALTKEELSSVSPDPRAPASQSLSPPPFSAALDSLVPLSLPGNANKTISLQASPPPSAPLAEAYPVSDLSASALPYQIANENNHTNDQTFTPTVTLPPPVTAPHVTTDDHQHQQHSQHKHVMVQIPPNSPPGTLIYVRAPDGQLIEARVPPGNIRQFLVAYAPTEQQPESMSPQNNQEQHSCHPQMHTRYPISSYQASNQQGDRSNHNQTSTGQHRDNNNNSGSSLMPFLGGAALGAAAMAIMEHSFGDHDRNFGVGGGGDQADY